MGTANLTDLYNKILFIFSSGFDSFSNTGNRDTRANNYLNYEPEQVRYQDRGHYEEQHNAYNPDPNSYNSQRDRNSYNQDYYTRGRDPYTEQTIQSYPPQDKFYSDPYNGYGEVINNEILGEFLRVFLIHSH